MGLVFSKVSFDYPKIPVLKDLDFTFDEGITAVMGPNGSGKTTLLQLAAGILEAHQGEISLDGDRFPGAVGKMRRDLGYAPQSSDFPEHLTARKLIRYLAQIRFLDPRLGMAEMERFGIAGLADRRLEELSAGEQRLVTIAQALMGAPGIILLDEFSRNLGIEDRHKVSRRLLDLAPGRTIIFSTHNSADVETLANRLVLLLGGQAVFTGSPFALIRAAEGHVFAVDSADKPRLAASNTCQICSDTRDGLRVVGELPAGIVGNSVVPMLEEACLWTFFLARKRGKD